jgi:hypothetical protein
MNSKSIAASPVHYRNDDYDCTSQFKEGILEGVDLFTETQVCIPNGWWLNSNELNYIVQTINDFENE